MHSFVGQAVCLTLLPLLLFRASPVSGQESAKRIAQAADRALTARQKIMQQDAVAADVDALLALCTDNLIYEDPVVGMKIEGKKQIREGMLGFLGVTRHATSVVTKRIAVANVVVLDLVVSFEEQQADAWKSTSRHQVTVFEFEGARIRRIADYWQR